MSKKINRACRGGNGASALGRYNFKGCKFVHIIFNVIFMIIEGVLYKCDEHFEISDHF